MAPWDLGMFLQLILGAQKRITRLGMLVTSPPGSGGGATWHVPSLLGVDASVSPLCLNFPCLQNPRKPPTAPGEKSLELRV